MRWFDRDDGGVSNRELLSNALEGTVQNEVEARRLAQYKVQIHKVPRCKRTNSWLPLNDISFGTGPFDDKIF